MAGEVPPLRRGKTLVPEAGYPGRYPEASFSSLFHDIAKVSLLSRFVTVFGHFSDIFLTRFRQTRQDDKTRQDMTRQNMSIPLCFVI